MAIIFTYPEKSNPVDNDLVLISDSEDSNKTKQVTISDIRSATVSGVSQIIAGTNITISPVTGTGVVTINSSGGSGTVTSVGLTMPAAFSVANSPVTTSGTLAVTTTGGSAGQYLDYTGAWSTPPSGDTYTLQAEPKSSNSVPLKLDAASGTDSTVSLTEGANVTLTRNSATEITIAATGGGAGVSSFTNANGTYISAGTENTAATGAVTVGTIDLSAVDGTAVASTRFLSKDNTWDVPAYTTYNAASSTTLGLMKLASDTEQTVAANAVTTEASRTYGIQFNADDQAVVNVPWTDTNTTSITLTTTGSSGASTWDGTTLNIPQYATAPAGSNTQIQYNNSGSFGATDLFTYSSRILSVGKVSDTSRSHLKVFGGGTEDSYLTLYCSAGTHGVTIEGPDHTGGSNYTLKLPASLPSVANQVLESNASGILSWIPTPSGGGSSKLGFTPLSIYGATHEIASGQAGKTIYRQSVVETDCTIDKVDFFVTAVTGTCNLTVAVYTGNLTTATRVLVGTSGALTTGVNTITFTASHTFSAGDDIVIYTSQSAGEEISNSIAGDSGLLNNALLSRGDASYDATPATSISPPETSSAEGLALHFYDE